MKGVNSIRVASVTGKNVGREFLLLLFFSFSFSFLIAATSRFISLSPSHNKQTHFPTPFFFFFFFLCNSLSHLACLRSSLKRRRLLSDSSATFIRLVLLYQFRILTFIRFPASVRILLTIIRFLFLWLSVCTRFISFSLFVSDASSSRFCSFSSFILSRVRCCLFLPRVCSL